MKVLISEREAVVFRAAVLTVKAEDENGCTKSDTLARMFGRLACGTPSASLVNGYVKSVPYSAVPFGKVPLTRSAYRVTVDPTA